MRRATRRSAIAAVAAVALASPPALQAQEPPASDRDCFWQGGNRTVNIAYPDLGARYWVSAFPLPPGAELVLRGRYPHARYFSFNVYDPALRPTDGVPDIDVGPDPGSTNPFVAGAARDAEPRDYTVRVVSGTPPAQREPNTIYLNTGGQAAVYGQIIYRVYVPDRGLPADGGVGVPEVSLRLPGGTELDQPATCAARDSAVGPTIDGLQADLDGPGTAPANPGAEDPIRWEAFFNYAQAFSYPLQAAPAGGGRDVVPRDPQGGFLSNIDNAYTLALASRGIAPVLVFEGKAPTTPTTLDGDSVMGTGQVRYWSLCENEFASQRVIDCLYDQQVLTNDDGRFTIVMSTPGSRPENAIPECGVSFLRWGAQPDALPILRHMLPSVDFAEAIQNVAVAGTETDVIGEYLPVGTHTTKSEFESRGCKAAAGGGGGDGGGGPGGACANRVVGTPGPNRLRGTSGADRLLGRRGRDRLSARAGDDCLGGGRGADVLRGGRGSDVLNCGRGRDLAIADPSDRTRRCERIRDRGP